MRNELKFLITAQEKLELLKQWEGFLKPDPIHPRYSLASMYFDSYDLSFYREKLEGLSLRRKLRMRTYSFDFFSAEKGILEIKGREDQKVYKKRIPLGMSAIKKCVLENDWSEISREPKALDYLPFLWGGGIYPVTMISYVREAYLDPIDGDCRVTLDSYVSAFEPKKNDLRGYFHNPRNLIIPEGMFILEIKTSDLLPIWVAQAVRQLQLQRRSISKYALGIEFLYFSKRIFNEESLL